MLCNEFGAQGFALDISADALRHGRALMDRWELDRAPIRIAGDAANLPFADNSMRMVLAFQMLSQFMDIEAVFLEVKRVLMPGGVFFFAEEPIRRMLSLRLYRAPYWEQMKPWERKLHRMGLLGYLAKDVIGAHQEESFGIRQNHRMKLKDWDRLIKKHFADQRYEIFIADRGPGEAVVRKLGRKIDKHGSDWVPARLLGGTLAALCKMHGSAPEFTSGDLALDFEKRLRCPDCQWALIRDDAESLHCRNCGYAATNEGGVYNLLPSVERKELYPGLRPDVIDFSLSDCDDRIAGGFYQVEGIYGNKYRWIGERAAFQLQRLASGPQMLRIRGHASEAFLRGATPAVIEVRANGKKVLTQAMDRPGLFVLEAPLPEAPSYEVEVLASPRYQAPPDQRWFTVNLSLMRLVSE
jgi:hypothetical protein